MSNFKVDPASDITINILLADDDRDDHFFFERALKGLPFKTILTTVEDGEKLMTLLKNSGSLPDVLFLDNNMPRKNGSESLLEIKLDPKLQNLPVIIYSTYLHEDVADILYNNGAHFYVRKTSLAELKKVLLQIFTLISEKKIIRPAREHFILSPARYNS